ncbi:phage integrase family protein [Mycobacteroides abscessus subsp. abscessus]|nr:phage integrase family protein [Mycobacteroides abscessus subsp. abscessus]SLJ11685.1 phage integrase family protein [Mycobacteroides abscessus subsp. abscessus]SLJ80984.1 phage integrase family protein [Mycobacteroides abscessus subsp. abscessus]
MGAAMARGDSGTAHRQLGQHPTLRVPDGPWCQPTWHVVDVPGDRRRQGADPCSVDDCDGQRYWLGGPGAAPGAASGLCYAHYFQWFRAGQPADFDAWAQTESRPVGPPRGRPSTKAVDFRRLPPTAAEEVRFVVATKVQRGDWTPNASLRRVLIVLVDTASSRITNSLTERPAADWLLLCRQHWSHTSSFDTLCAPYIRTFFRLLHGATHPDPWASDHWHWRDGFEFVLDATQSGSTHTAVDWSSVAVPWLKVAVKSLARQQLTTATLSWGTLTQWVRATRQFAQFLTQDNTVPNPPAVTRPVFLDYLAWTRRDDTAADARLANTGAYLLECLHDTGLVTDLGSTMFLRRGENVHRKTRNPRPFPPDVIERIDTLIVDNPATDPTIRAMIATNRWAGCRISELVALPIDCLHHSDAGHWIEYWMPKTSAWRRFPIPDDLAEVILAQQARVRDTYGPDAIHLFPGARSSATAGRTQPWSTSGLRHRLSALFREHGITSSTITGESISGGDVHRFRHTVGMTLLNNGWTQQEVRDFLGHQSDTMTSTYARITDDTLARKAREFWENKPENSSTGDAGVERLRARFTAALPNGFCTLPAAQRCEFRPNPCLDCSFHDPGGRVFLGIHIAHRDQLQSLAADAAERGDTDAAKLNTTMLDKVTKLIGEIDPDARPATP